VERCGGATGKPTAALPVVGVADKKADVAQPLDPRAKVGAGVAALRERFWERFFFWVAVRSRIVAGTDFEGFFLVAVRSRIVAGTDFEGFFLGGGAFPHRCGNGFWRDFFLGGGAFPQRCGNGISLAGNTIF
jgi:hypothetical protein